jgi:hypothetical protein
LFLELVNLEFFDPWLWSRSPKLGYKKCKKREWELNQVFQKVWVAKFPWAKFVVSVMVN